MTTTTAALAPENDAGRIRVTCTHRKCDDQVVTLGTWAATAAFMDEHVREVAHPRQWPVAFRVTYVLSGNVTAEYREPVKIA